MKLNLSYQKRLALIKFQKGKTSIFPQYFLEVVEKFSSIDTVGTRSTKLQCRSGKLKLKLGSGKTKCTA